MEITIRAREPQGAAAWLWLYSHPDVCPGRLQLAGEHPYDAGGFSHHDRAQRLYERLGFEREGGMRQAALRDVVMIVKLLNES